MLNQRVEVYTLEGRLLATLVFSVDGEKFSFKSLYLTKPLYLNKILVLNFLSVDFLSPFPATTFLSVSKNNPSDPFY